MSTLDAASAVARLAKAIDANTVPVQPGTYAANCVLYTASGTPAGSIPPTSVRTLPLSERTMLLAMAQMIGLTPTMSLIELGERAADLGVVLVVFDPLPPSLSRATVRAAARYQAIGRDGDASSTIGSHTAAEATCLAVADALAGPPSQSDRAATPAGIAARKALARWRGRSLPPRPARRSAAAT